MRVPPPIARSWQALAPDLIFDDISRLPELLGNGVLRRRDRPIR